VAADHPRRELWVAHSAVKAIVAAKLAPSIADRYLARTGYDAQQTDEPVPADRPCNLYEPVEGLHATHGRFDAQASGRSPELWASERRGRIAGGVAVAAGLAALLARR